MKARRSVRAALFSPMTGYLLPLLLLLLILGIVLQDNFVFTLFYLLAGSYVLGGWWSRRALRAVRGSRSYPRRIFHGETAEIRLDINNSGWLPVIWVRLHESRPVELSVSDPVRRIFSLGPRARTSFSYSLIGRKRGYYRLGPASLSSGDLLGLSGRRAQQGPADFLTVFPKIIALPELPVRSQLPLGALRYHLPFFEDPSRSIGKREYQTGDSLRSIDWKASANVGRLQVKVKEPSVSLETGIFLNLAAPDYDRRSRFDSIELAIVAAASLASWVIGGKQALGLVTNGTDPLLPQPQSVSIAVGRGRGHLLQVLELLARIRTGEARSLEDLIRERSHQLAWGAMMAVITGHLNDQALKACFLGRRHGLGILLILVGPNARAGELKARARRFKMPLLHIHRERDLMQLGRLNAVD